MAAAGEDEVEYESDPEETKGSLVMRRRRAASDDEESEGEVERDMEGSNHGGRIRSDESDGQGGVADYDEDEQEVEEEGEEYEEEEVYDEEEEGVNEHDDGRVVHSESVGSGGGGTALEEKVAVPVHLHDDGGKPVDGFADDLPLDQGGEQEKKENEPYAVPTAGAFYMHDDRFRDNVGGRHRRTFGGRKLWESKDDRKWGHDKFEEMTMQERRYDERRRTSRGRYRGRGRSRAADRGYVRGRKGENLNNGGNVNSGTTNNSSNQTHMPASVRGRGPRRYGSSFKKTNPVIPSQTKQSAKPLEKTAHDNSGKAVKAASDGAPPRKNAFASSLNSASPPFYPSTSSSKDIAFSQNKDAQAGVSNHSFRPSSSEKLPVPQSDALLRGQNIANSIGMEKLRIEDTGAAPAGKSITSVQAGPSGSSMNSQSPQVIVSGSRPAVRTGQMPYEQTFPRDLVNRLSLPMQVHGSHGTFAANKVQSSVQGSFQKFGQRSSGGSQASPPKTAVSVNSYEAGEAESPSDFSKSKGALVGKSKGNMQGSGRSSFSYGNPNVVGAGGNIGMGHGDKKFPGTPAFLPVMHFGGQHPGGMGVPTVGMAFPGYVAQPQMGVGNSEMTWLPVLASAAGALGATYCSPYIGMDGNYHTSTSGQTTSMGSSSKESQVDIPASELKPSQRPELASEEHGQRQNKSRRYSEMNFGQ